MMDRADRELLGQLLEAKKQRIARRKILTMYPDSGPLAYTQYPKHMQFFAAGATATERCAIAANRVGKTEGMGGYELVCHLTGKYPHWWVGRRFNHPIDAWCAGTTGQTTRDIIQAKLLGPISDIGTGLIPGDDIVGEPKRKAGSVPDTIESVVVKHYTDGVHDGNSTIGLKSYEQGRKAFEGTEKHVIWCDEEPPLDVYVECLLRLMTTKGLMMLTFTPLQGVSDVVLMFLPGGRAPATVPDTGIDRVCINATWDDAPHLSAEDKARLWASIPVHLRAARSAGVPALGSGAIYPIAETDIVVSDFAIPVYWPRAYAFDPGWNFTAALWGAIDRDNDILYLCSEYKRGQSEPAVHAAAIQSRGKWMPGVADPASRASSQKDGEKLLDEYIRLGLNLSIADNAVEAGLFDVYERMTTGRLKVFQSLTEWLSEFRVYRRDEKGKVVKANDHLMDCTRYLVRTGIYAAQIAPLDLIAHKLPFAQRENNDEDLLRQGLRG